VHVPVFYDRIHFFVATQDEVLEEIVPTHEEAAASAAETRLLPRTSLILRHEPIQKDYVFRNTCAHFGSTLLIIGICYCGAVLVRGVAYVWRRVNFM
jgi:hypothetical protein